MIQYLLHTTSIWIVLFIAYKILLSKEKYFILNRFYLICSLAVGLILPLVQFIDFYSRPVLPNASAIYYDQVNYISQLSVTASASTTEHSSLDWTAIIFLLITIGMAVMLFKNVIAGLRLKYLYKNSEKYHHKEFTEVLTQKEHLPFSFFRYIFFSAFKLTESDRISILNHEIHHVKAKHTWDVLFVELIKVFFWWNPLVYFYKRAITENHEFSADHSAIAQSSRKEYCSLLLQANMPGVNLDLGHPFFSTYIKKRIDMMYRKKSTRKSYLKFILPMFAIVFMAFIIKDDHLELDYTLDSDYIDLFADDELLIPNEDYIIDRERGKVVVFNQRDNSTTGVKYCMFIIDEPRTETEIEAVSRPEFSDFISVHIHEDGTKSVGDEFMTTKQILERVQRLESRLEKKIKVKLTIDDNVKNELVIEFFDEAFEVNTSVTLDESEPSFDESIPSISPLAPKDVIKNYGFGTRLHPVLKLRKFHKGLDLVANMNTPVFATAEGRVSKVSVEVGGYGKYIIIDHQNGFTTMYCHLNDFAISEGDEVRQGDHIGFVGTTGLSSKPHLHYEVRFKGRAEDPAKYGALVTNIDVRDLNSNSKEKSIIELGLNVNQRVVVKVSEQILKEGVDYEIDYQLGRLKIINENFLTGDQPINVEFESNESDQIFYKNESNHSVAKKFKRDMTFNRECHSNNDGVYFIADKMATIKECNTGDFEEDYSCTMNKISTYIGENRLYPEEMVKKGFQGMLMFNVVIDENGKIESYREVLRKQRGDDYPELIKEGDRLMELVKKNIVLSPAQCNGENVKSVLHLSTRFKLNDDQLRRVERRDASNTPNPNQIVSLTGMSQRGGTAFTYYTEMNVPYTVKITDPLGELIYNESFDYIYMSNRVGLDVPNLVNGKYVIEVTQDGKTVSSSMNCTLF